MHAMLLDEGRYLGSVRTMYRLLNRAVRVSGAANSPTRPTSSPNCWRWHRTRSDPGIITKLKGPAKWTCFHLYVILDIFSRHVVGWLIAESESADLTEQLIADSVSRHDRPIQRK